MIIKKLTDNRVARIARFEGRDANEDAKVIYLTSHRVKGTLKSCNLCDLPFKPESKFERFCPECKETSELYHYIEWLPAS